MYLVIAYGLGVLTLLMVLVLLWLGGSIGETTRPIGLDYFLRARELRPFLHAFGSWWCPAYRR